jgi:hypothetical protein
LNEILGIDAPRLKLFDVLPEEETSSENHEEAHQIASRGKKAGSRSRREDICEFSNPKKYSCGSCEGEQSPNNYAKPLHRNYPWL